jgi:predicted RNA-binding Zn-ribbon protein involved in translation (DUF1610 family)
MDTVFRIKRGRDTIRTKHEDIMCGTLDSIHQNIVTMIKSHTINLETLREHIEEIEKKTEPLENSTDLNDILKSSKLREELKQCKERYDEQNSLENYYVKNADIMLKYYGESEKTQVVTTNVADQNTFLKYLNSSNITTDLPQNSKKHLYEEFTTRMKINTGHEINEQKDAATEHCSNCNIAREENSEEGILVCPQCGSEEYMMVVSDFPSFRDPPKERNNYAYKKINHLNEILNQFQAKESTIIPDEVMNEVICEVKKRRIVNIADMTEKDIREILKKINRSKYYEHATHILSRLNGNPPPTITPEIEEKIRTMFQEIQAPFLLYCPDDRTNFLSYSYILYKFFELLELDDYKVYFPLLKSRDRLIAHDQIWKKICDYLKWECITSV